ncbi:MAG: flavohemoglobin expression-modulating QEGLA motif protein [Acidimicrobiia bacterium]
MDLYRVTIKDLSDRIVRAQRPIKVLSAINWGESVKREFFDSGFKSQPAVDREYYESRAIRLDPSQTREELRSIQAEVISRLGPISPAGSLMRFMCEQFLLTVDLIEARGTDRFSPIASALYGTPSDVFHVGGPTVADLARVMRLTLEANAMAIMEMEDDRTIPGTEAAATLRRQLDASVGKGLIEVRVDDGIASDAAAGSTYIKMRSDRFFSQRDIDLLEAHEGWVHVSTTQNGLSQPVCTFLGKAAPRSTVTQEGLAVLTEMLNLRSHPRRLAKLMRRIEAIELAAKGATFLDVFRSSLDDGLSEDDSWTTASRVFRGSLPEAGPFTKDLGYGKGLILTLLYVRMAIRFGKTGRIPMLFCGKVDLLDMATLHQLFDEDLVERPSFVPPPFNDLPALASTLSLGRFTSQLDLDRMSADFERLF